MIEVLTAIAVVIGGCIISVLLGFIGLALAAYLSGE